MANELGIVQRLRKERQRTPLPKQGIFSPGFCERPDLSGYFNFTNNKTKIAHTPTVTGNTTNWASRIVLPRGNA
jgi:hypothetical protein